MRRFAWTAAFAAGLGACLWGCSQRLAGGETSGTETGNARVAGIVVDSLGRGMAGVRVTAYPEDYDPGRDEEVAGRAITDSSGRYALRLDSAGSYTVVAIAGDGGDRCLAAKVRALPTPQVGESSVRMDTLRAMGSGILPLPPDFAGSAGYLYLVGTPFLIRGADLGAGTRFGRLDSLPAGDMPEIRIHSATAGDRTYAPSGAVSVSPGISRAAAILPAPWMGQSLGETVRGGGAGADGTFHLTGGGHDIWGVRDGCYFVHQEREGDFVLTARLTLLERTAPWSKAALMVRGTLDPGSPSAALSFLMGFEQNPAIDQVVMHVRPGFGDSSRPVLPDRQGYPGPPAWMRLVREGNRMTALVSEDGKAWSPLSTTVMELPARVFVGLAQTSAEPFNLGKAIFEEVTLTPDPP